MKAPKLALAIRHVAFEDCGTLGDVLAARGMDVRYVDVGRESLSGVELAGADLIVGLGGPVSVYDERRYPWIRDELKLFERGLALEKPTLGICLGAQMLAHVLGSRVYPGPVKELGWKPLRLTPAGSESVASPLAGELTSMFHWHGDTFDLPGGATLLASTGAVAQQIYRWNRNVLGFQCHPEIRGRDIELWLIGHANELAAASGLDIPELRAETARLAPTLETQARTVFERWLTTLGL